VIQEHSKVDIADKPPTKEIPFPGKMFTDPCSSLTVEEDFGRVNDQKVLGSLVAVQLLPPSCESRSSKDTQVEKLGVMFSNQQTRTDLNVSIHLKIPLAKKISCNSDRITIAEGPTNELQSGAIQLVAPQLAPKENHFCQIDLVNPAIEGTPAQWRQNFGRYVAYSDSPRHPTAMLYRLHYGPQENSKNPKYLTRSITLELDQ
jgi:hypothetical protein